MDLQAMNIQIPAGTYRRYNMLSLERPNLTSTRAMRQIAPYTSLNT